jgi:sulfatase modifying factor 1
MVRLDGRFHMGSESPEAFPTDGEGPVRQVTLTAFYISKYAVTNEQFAEFAGRTGYRTEAQRFGSHTKRLMPRNLRSFPSKPFTQLQPRDN